MSEESFKFNIDAKNNRIMTVEVITDKPDGSSQDEQSIEGSILNVFVSFHSKQNNPIFFKCCV